jgi:hypothetical protein
MNVITFVLLTGLVCAVGLGYGIWVSQYRYF